MQPHHLDTRLTTYPIGRPLLFELYETARKQFWAPSDISFAKDAAHFKQLSASEQHAIIYIVGFFASSDGIVNVNIADRFKREINILEATYFYNFQAAMEDVHAHTYSIILDALIEDSAERLKALDARNSIPIIKAMSEYMFCCVNSDAPLAERLLRFACVEGIFFAGCFCIIYWFQNRGLMPGLGQSNELIARDETLHTIFGLILHNLCIDKLSEAATHHIIAEAVDIAVEFAAAALPTAMVGMNKVLMEQYIKYEADELLELVGCARLYNADITFAFMVQIKLKNKTNFFERRVSEYAKSSVADTREFEMVAEF